MLDPSEYELDKPPTPTEDVQPVRSRKPWLVAAAAILALGAAAWFFVARRQAPQPAAEQPAATVAPPPAAQAALCETSDAAALPSLNDSDTSVRTLVRPLSVH